MNMYDIVKDILVRYPETRSSDKYLIWEVLRLLGFLEAGQLTWDRFRKTPPLESITRARRKVQEMHPELQANETVREIRRQKSVGNPIDIFKGL